MSPAGDRDQPAPDVEFVEVYRQGIRATPEAVGVLADDGRVLDLNASAERLLGQARDHAVGRNTRELGWWVDPADLDAFRADVVRSGSSVRRVRLRRADGTDRDVYVAAVRVDVGGRMFVFWIGRDVTGQPMSNAETERLTEALRRSITERRRLVLVLLHAAEQDRIRLSDEFRAGPIQQLTAAQISLEAVQDRLGPLESEAVERVQSSIAEVIRELRRIRWEIRPVQLEREGLGAAVRTLLLEFEQTDGLSFDLDDGTAPAGSPNGASGDTSAFAYRVIFETLMSVRRVGGADHVDVTLVGRDAQLVVTVSIEGLDLGAGQDPAAALEIETLRELLSAVDGTVELRRTDPSTVAITVSLPSSL